MKKFNEFLGKILMCYGIGLWKCSIMFLVRAMTYVKVSVRSEVKLESSRVPSRSLSKCLLSYHNILNV